MNRISKLSVSLMCADLVNLERDIHILEENGVDYLHVDIMDAAFVPNKVFWRMRLLLNRGVRNLD